MSDAVATMASIKIVAVIFGLFLAGLAYLQYHQIAILNWNKLQTVLSEGTITTLSNVIIIQIPGVSSISSGAEVLAMYDDKKTHIFVLQTR